MKVIGLTGGTGSGKGVVSAVLAQNGAFIIDADKIAREIVEPGRPAYNELLEYFGKGILDPEGNINRRALGDIVFGDKRKLLFLNQCTHRYINMEILDRIAFAKANPGLFSCIVIDAPLLLEAGLDSVCDEIWVVYASAEVRTRRIMLRDGITEEQARKRMLSQMSWEEYEKSSTVIIDNSGALEEVQKQVCERIGGCMAPLDE